MLTRNLANFMDYESIKKDFNAVIGGSALLTKIFNFVFGRFFLRVRYVKKALIHLINACTGENPKMLDAGCGTGVYSYFAGKKYSRMNIVSGDIQQIHIDNFSRFASAERLDNIKVELIDLTKMDYSSEFDIVTSIDVMEHIEDDVKVFQNICKALKEKGVLLLHTPHVSEISARHEGAFNDDHVREGYSGEEITNKLHNAGFSNIEYKLTYGTFGQTAWRLLQKIPITLAGISKLFYLVLPFYFLFAYPLAEILMFLDTITDNKEGGGILVTARK